MLLRLPVPASGQVATGQIIHIAIPAAIDGTAVLNCPASASCTINGGASNFGILLSPSTVCPSASTVRCEGYDDPVTSGGTTTTNNYQCVRTCTASLNSNSI